MGRGDTRLRRGSGGAARVDCDIGAGDHAGSIAQQKRRNQQTREKCLALAERLGLAPYTVLHPDAYVSDTASIGAGVYVAAHSSISSRARVHDHVIVNYNVTVGHDGVIGSHSVLNPGARISGNVSVGERVLIGANAFVFQGKQVGSDSRVDALTYIDRDIPPHSICSSKRLEVHKRVI